MLSAHFSADVSSFTMLLNTERSLSVPWFPTMTNISGVTLEGPEALPLFTQCKTSDTSLTDSS